MLGCSSVPCHPAAPGQKSLLNFPVRFARLPVARDCAGGPLQNWIVSLGGPLVLCHLERLTSVLLVQGAHPCAGVSRCRCSFLEETRARILVSRSNEPRAQNGSPDFASKSQNKGPFVVQTSIKPPIVATLKAHETQPNSRLFARPDAAARLPAQHLAARAPRKIG